MSTLLRSMSIPLVPLQQGIYIFFLMNYCEYSVTLFELFVARTMRETFDIHRERFYVNARGVGTRNTEDCPGGLFQDYF